MLGALGDAPRRATGGGVVTTTGMRRLGALVRYLLVDLVHAQRVLIPVVVYVVVAGVLLAGDHVAAPGPWPASTLALYPVAAWVALVVANGEDPAQRAVTVASAGGPGIVTAGTVLAALLIDVVLVVVAVAVPGVVSPAGFPPSQLVEGTLTHVTAALTGTAVGLALARPVVDRVGWSFTLAALVVAVTGTQPWLPPVGSAVASLGATRSAVGLPIDLLVAVVLLAAAGTLSWSTSRRQ